MTVSMSHVDPFWTVFIYSTISDLAKMASTRRVAIVTGSNKGIGLAIVRKLCRQFDGDVFLTARSEERGKEAVKTLEAEGLSPKFHQLDITSPASIEELRKFTVDTYGGFDILVNNAGIAYKGASTAPDIEQATVTLNTNFTGTLNMLKAFAPIIRPHGRIVNVASWVGLFSRLSSQALRDKFANPSLTEEELVALMDQFIEDVREGKHKERGWANTFYSNSKVAMIALSNVYARKLASSGECGFHTMHTGTARGCLTINYLCAYSIH